MTDTLIRPTDEVARPVGKPYHVAAGRQRDGALQGVGADDGDGTPSTSAVPATDVGVAQHQHADRGALDTTLVPPS